MFVNILTCLLQNFFCGPQFHLARLRKILNLSRFCSLQTSGDSDRCAVYWIQKFQVSNKTDLSSLDDEVYKFFFFCGIYCG